jgi:hypothetical protein
LVPRAELDGEMGDSLPGLTSASDVAGVAQDHSDRGKFTHNIHLHQPAS